MPSDSDSDGERTKKKRARVDRPPKKKDNSKALLVPCPPALLTDLQLFQRRKKTTMRMREVMKTRERALLMMRMKA